MFRDAPLLRLVLPLLLGVWLASEFAISLPLSVAVAGASLLLLFVWLSIPRLRRGGRSFMDCLTVVLFCALGAMLVYVHNPYVSGNHYSKWCAMGERIAVKARIVETPQEKPKTMAVVAELEHCNIDGLWYETSGKLMMYVAKDANSRRLRYGDCLEGTLTLSDPGKALNPYQFDYRKYLYRRGIAAVTFLKEDAYKVYDHRSCGLMEWSKELQRALVERLRRTQMNPSYQGLAEALLLGWKQDIDETLEAQFRDAGIMHLLCVSGLHVGLVTAIIGDCLFFLPRTRWWNLLRMLLLLVGTWTFVCVTGMASATVRAGVMFSVYVIGRISGKLGNSLNALAFAALVLLFVNPWCLYDVGFQLSFTAVMGIILLFDPLNRLYPQRLLLAKNGGLHLLSTILQQLWRLVCLSMSAQLATLPIMMYYFHQFPIYFLIANILVVPFAGVLLVGVLLVALTLHWGMLGVVFTKVLVWLFSLVDAVTRWVASLPGAVIENIYCDELLALLCALMVALVVVALRRKKTVWISLSWVSLFAVVCYAAVVDFRCVRNLQLVVYADSPVVAAEIFDGKESYLFVDAPLTSAPDTLCYQREGLLRHNKVRTTYVCPLDTVLLRESFAMDRGVLSFQKTRLLVVGVSNMHCWLQRKEKQCGDGLVVAGVRPFELEDLRLNVQCDTVVVGSGGNRWRMDALRDYCCDNQIPCRDLRITGAIVKCAATD